MPNDLVSRADVMAAVKKQFIKRQWRDRATGATLQLGSVLEAIAALPAAGDERWEKTRSLHDLISVLFPLPESVDELVDAAQTMVREGVNFDNDEDEVESASHVVGWRDSLVAALRQSHELVSLSQPPQEAGDEPPGPSA